MSFTFKWPRFSDQFHADTIQMLDAALNKGPKPPVIADRIEVVELEMGTQPPELEIRDIGELTMDQFRGIFRLTYSGDAHIVLRTKVQANPLNHKQPDLHLMGGSRGMLAAKQPLVVPMLLRLSHFKLNSYVVLVVSRQKGITLVFKTDPLQNVDINSTFDSIAVIQKFIQREIEGQLRQMFREDLPGIIHRLSQQWVKAKVEAPYLDRHPPPTQQWSRETASNPDYPMYRPLRMPMLGAQAPFALRPVVPRPSSFSGYAHPRTASVYSASSAGRSRKPPSSSVSSPTTPAPPPAPEGPTSFPEIENFDPTYGLRPEGLPTKSLFGGFRNLFAAKKGLADLAEEPSEIDDSLDETGSYGMATWDDLLSDYNPPPSLAGTEADAETRTEYESVPAVGGGVITRPRIVHSQSQIQPPSEVGSVVGTSTAATRTPFASRSGLVAPMLSRPSMSLPPTPGRYSSNYNPYFAGATPLHMPSPLVSQPISEDGWAGDELSDSFDTSVPPLDRRRRPGSSSSLQTQPSRSTDMTHSVRTPPNEEDTGIHIRPRRLSLTSSNLDNFHSGSPPDHYMLDQDPKIVLRPAVNNTVSQLSTLSHSNHTLSPYTRTFEHFTVRSVPPREPAAGPLPVAERPPVRGKRKRTHRLGGAKPAPPPDRSGGTSPQSAASAPLFPPDLDVADMDRYFRAHDELSSPGLPPRFASPSPSPELRAQLPSHARRRFGYPSSLA